MESLSDKAYHFLLTSYHILSNIIISYLIIYRISSYNISSYDISSYHISSYHISSNIIISYLLQEIQFFDQGVTDAVESALRSPTAGSVSSKKIGVKYECISSYYFCYFCIYLKEVDGGGLCPILL